MRSLDELHMRRALFHAARGQGRTTPNPMVGAIVVSTDGVVVGQGWHQRAGTPHAEVHALDEAGERARGATLYVTLEPCCHTGRTGPCTRRIITAGVARVVAAMTDPDERVAGRGFAELRAHDVRVDEGLCRDEARRLNRAFMTVKTMGRPFIMLKAATSLDGCVAAARGQRTAITSREANTMTQLLRASVDAVAIGSETALVDDPLLTARDCHRVRPLVRVVFDRRLRISPASRLFSTFDDGPVVIITDPPDASRLPRARALEAAGAALVTADGLRAALDGLLQWEVSSVLVEGGPSLHAALVREGLADALHLAVAPHLLGPAGIKWLDAETLPTAWLAPVAVAPRGPDVWIEADVHRHH